MSRDHLTVYPMLDNVVQSNVVSAGSKFLPSVLNGTITVQQALSNLKTTWSLLPAPSRGSSYH